MITCTDKTCKYNKQNKCEAKNIKLSHKTCDTKEGKIKSLKCETYKPNEAMKEILKAIFK